MQFHNLSIIGVSLFSSTLIALVVGEAQLTRSEDWTIHNDKRIVNTMADDKIFLDIESVIECGALCLADENCKQANYMEKQCRLLVNDDKEMENVNGSVAIVKSK